MLYVIPVPIGAEIVIVPVATVHEGWVIFTVGAAGVAGCGFTVTVLGNEKQPPTDPELNA